MLENSLETLKALLLLYLPDYSGGFVASNVIHDGYYVDKHEHALNFSTDRGDHFYLRDTDVVTLTNFDFNSEAPDYWYIAPCRLIGCKIKPKKSVDTILQEMLTALMESAGMNSGFYIEIKNYNSDPYSVFYAETDKQEVDLRSKAIYSIDFLLKFTSSLACQKTTNCCE